MCVQHDESFDLLSDATGLAKCMVRVLAAEAAADEALCLYVVLVGDR